MPESTQSPQYLLNTSLSSTLVAEQLSGVGFDGAVLDLQHGDLDRKDAVALTQIWQAAGSTVWARVPDYDRAVIGRLLDAGVTGVVRPMVETHEQAREHVEACLFPPLGRRSYGPVRPVSASEDYFECANDQVKPLVQIESQRGLANLAEIVDVPGLAGVYVGPMDLHRSMGLPLPMDPHDTRLASAVSSIAEACTERGLLCGSYAGSVAEARFWRDLSFDFIILQTDMAMLTQAAERTLARVKEFA